MKIAALVANYLLGTVFFVFGLNFFLHFIPMPAPEGNALAFMGAIASTGYLAVVKVLEILLGAMMLLQFRKHLAYVLIAPIIVNIFLYEIFLLGAPAIGVVLVILNVFLLIADKEKYESLINA